jgi:hypothetical protein
MKKAAAAALCVLVGVAFVPASDAAGAIFPSPIHITREVHDPISEKTVVLNEYGYGNRLVSVRGDVTAIADYEKGELTEIDRAAGTYSVTRFETFARAAQLAGGGEPESPSLSQTPKRDVKSLAAKPTKSGRPADFFRAEGQSLAVEVAVDRSVRVSKEALEVLLGTAYPGTRSEQHDLVMAAASGGMSGERPVAADAAARRDDYALPLEQLFEIKLGDDRVEFRSSVLRVAPEPPPAEILAIPPGARLVVSRTAAVVRELELLDAAPLRPPAKP